MSPTRSAGRPSMTPGQAVADEHDREQRRSQSGGHQGGDRRRQGHRRAQHREARPRWSAAPSRPGYAVDGSRTSAPTMASTAAMAQPPASQASLPSPIRAATNAIKSGNVGAVIRAACSQIQSLPSLDEQRCGRDGEHERDQQHRDAVGDDRREHDQRHQHEQAEVLRVPAPGQGEATATDHGGEHQADGCGHPVVDRRDRDDVHVRRGDTGRGQGDGADPSARRGRSAGRRRRRAPRLAVRLRRHGFRGGGCRPGRRARAAERRR